MSQLVSDQCSHCALKVKPGKQDPRHHDGISERVNCLVVGLQSKRIESQENQPDVHIKRAVAQASTVSFLKFWP